MNTQSVLRFATTLLIFLLAILVGAALWKHYMYSPWTRDGRVRAEVVKIAPDVAGLVTSVNVVDNQFVHQGDVMLVIDQARYQLTLNQLRANRAATQANVEAAVANIAAAKAAVVAKHADYQMYREQSERRQRIPQGTVISAEARSNAVAIARAAEASWHQAEASLGQAEAAHEQALAAETQAEAAVATAELNLRRTEVHAPVDGYATNVTVRVGDYASAGNQQMALIDSHSFYLYGYFEETKLPRLRVGDPVDIRLMAGGIHLKGKIIGVARGITDRDNPTGSNQLANVNPTFNWVRLAQRVPVRISIDPSQMPKGMVLSAGMTATVVVHPLRGEHGETAPAVTASAAH